MWGSKKCLKWKEIWKQRWVPCDKKNPLVLPPNFNDLPTPKDVADTTQIDNIENEIEDLLSSIKNDDEDAVESYSSNDTESFVLEKIKD